MPLETRSSLCPRSLTELAPMSTASVRTLPLPRITVR